MIRSFKDIFAVSAVVLAFVANPVSAQMKSAAAKKPATMTYKVDPKASMITWKGTKVTGAHNGKISVKDGVLQVEEGALKGGTVNIDMKTITNDDLSDASFNKKLVDHLRNDDFFGVDKHAVSTLKVTGIKPLSGDAGGNTHEITGDLTIKGKTQAVTFPAIVKVDGDKLTAKGTIKIDRTQYDIRYGSGKFFDNLGDKAIHDEFEIGVDVVAAK